MFLSDWYLLQFITGWQFESLRRALLNLLWIWAALSKLRMHRKVECLIQNGNS